MTGKGEVGEGRKETCSTGDELIMEWIVVRE
jgi:hypothetical protein